MEIVTIPYQGRFRGNRKIEYVYNNIENIINEAAGKVISASGGLVRLTDDVLHFGFTDMGTCVPFFTPSAISRCILPFRPGKGACSTYILLMGTEAFLSDYLGRTTFDKMLVHEMTHKLLMMNWPNHNKLPLYIIEGIAIETAGQGDDIIRTYRRHPFRMPRPPMHLYPYAVVKFRERFGGLPLPEVYREIGRLQSSL